MKTPLVTMLMPVATNSPYLRKTIESLLAQDYMNVEYVVIINFEDEFLMKVFNDYSFAGDVTFVTVPRSFKLGARLNAGILRSNGEYIARVDADDLYPTDRISSQVSYLNDSPPEIGLISGQALLIEEQGVVFGKISVPTRVEEITDKLLLKNCVIHPAVMVKKQVFSDSMYNPTVESAEDYDLWLRIGTKYKIANLNKVTISYRIHKSNMGRTRIPFRVIHQVSKSKIKYGKANDFGYFRILIAIVIWALKNCFFGPQTVTQLRRRYSFFQDTKSLNRD